MPNLDLRSNFSQAYASPQALSSFQAAIVSYPDRREAKANNVFGRSHRHELSGQLFKFSNLRTIQTSRMLIAFYSKTDWKRGNNI
jgi:hypothetical protein